MTAETTIKNPSNRPSVSLQVDLLLRHPVPQQAPRFPLVAFDFRPIFLQLESVHSLRRQSLRRFPRPLHHRYPHRPPQVQLLVLGG
jgi:hypothetical protein